MVKVYNDVVTNKEINELLDYFYIEDHRAEVRPDVRSKHPRWNIDAWPQDLVKNIVDRVLDRSWYPDDILFLDSHMQGQGFRLHVDSSDGKSNLYRNVLIPLYTEGDAATIFFKNYWNGPSTRFSRTPISPFSYPIMSVDGVVVVDDIRELLEQCKNYPQTVKNFAVDDDFIEMLKHLVDARSGKGLGTVDRCTLDYGDVINYDPSLNFDPAIHQNYMKHIPIENLHGLSIDEIVHWKIGSAIVFPRTQIHCASSTHTRKIGLSLFTNYVI